MFRIMIEADYALFTRPEMKVERVSYDVPTPSALEGVLKSIFWKPAIRYVIDKIIVFNPIKFFTLKRNEVKDKLAPTKVKTAMNGGEDAAIYTKESISQRSSTLLCDVKYGVEFHFEMTGICSDGEDECPAKYAAIINRRLAGGQCKEWPFMGCREFSVKSFYPVEEFDLSLVSDTLKGDRDLGYMLYGLDYKDDTQKLRSEWNAKYFSDKADAVFYRPHIVDGVIDVQRYRGELKC